MQMNQGAWEPWVVAVGAICHHHGLLNYEKMKPAGIGLHYINQGLLQNYLGAGVLRGEAQDTNLWPLSLHKTGNLSLGPPWALSEGTENLSAVIDRASWVQMLILTLSCSPGQG